MRQFTITTQGSLVVLEATEPDTSVKHSAQVTTEQFYVFMQFPQLTEAELVDKVWPVFDHSLGKKKCQETVQKVLNILRGEET